MQKKIYKILILTIIFISSLVFMSKNIKEEEITLKKAVAMDEAAFPLLYLKTDGITVNRLHGYSSSIDANVIREAVTPIDMDKELTVEFEENETVIKKIKYEIRELDENELLDSGNISALDTTKEGKTAKIKLDAGLATSKEYAMRITVITDQSRKIHFYTRIKYYESDYYLKEKLDFIINFHEKSMDKEKAQDLAMYLETDGSEDNKSFARVTIHSSFELFSWGQLKPKVITEVVPTIKEFNVETASVQLEYFVKAKTDSGTEVFNVKEFYRVRYTADRIYLLDYQRTMESQFDLELTSLSKSEFKLGITGSEDIDLVASAENSKMAFVQNGELWFYNLPENKAVRVFTFRSGKEDYFRNDYDQHDIQILGMDDGGNIDFTVYGYMNRGDYEGKVALILYHFSADTRRIEEMVYIPLETTYQMLKEDMNDFSYVSQRGIFYFTINHTIYSYNIAARRLEILVEDVAKDGYAILKDSHGLGWIEMDEAGNTKLIVMDLETEKRQEIPAPEGEIIRILGDIQSNILYGYVKKADIAESADGTMIIPAYKVEIADISGKVLKTYKEKNIYVVAAQVENNIAALTRMKKSGSGYKHVRNDSLYTQKGAEAQIIGIETRVTDKMLTEKYIYLPEGFAMETLPKMQVTTNVILEEDTTLHLDKEDITGERYYVYAKGGILSAFSNATEAILLADSEMGTVVNQNNRLVWERGGKFNRKTIGQIKETKVRDGVNSVGACLYMVLQHHQISADVKELSSTRKSIYNVLKENLKNPLTLTGCTLDEVLYFTSGGNIVIAMKNRKDGVIITGYDEYNITYFDPETGNKKTSISNASAMFEEAGNVFISYIN